MSETIRKYSTEDLAHLLYDEENPLGYSWTGCGRDVQNQYIERIDKSWQQRNVAECIAMSIELTGRHGGNGWLVNRDKMNDTNPEEIQLLALRKQLNKLQAQVELDRKIQNG